MKKLLACGLLLASCLAVGAWRLMNTSAPPVVVDVAPIKRGDLLSAITATGSLEASRSVDIKFDGQNYIQQLYVREGDRVRRNQIVARLETQLLDRSRDQDRQTVAKDEAGLAQAEANFRREEALWTEQLVARVEYDSARATYLAALHQREADAQALLGAEDQIGRATLRSPLDGIVTALYVHEGEMLGSAAAVAALLPGSATGKPTNTLMTIAAGGPLEVWTDINAADLGHARRGLPVDISLDAFRPSIFHGQVLSIGLQPSLVNGVTTYRAIATLAGATSQMRIGMPANVMVFEALARNALLAPAAALIGSGNAASVRVLLQTGARAAPRFKLISVEVLARSNSTVAVRGELDSGALVVVQGRAVSGQPCVLRQVSFRDRPSLEQSRLAGMAVTLPGPKPRGVIQRLFGF